MKSNAAAFPDAYSQRQHTYSFRRTTYCREKIRTNYGAQKLRHMVPQLLNAHPTITSVVEESCSVVAFKRKIHTYLLMVQKFPIYKIHKTFLVIEDWFCGCIFSFLSLKQVL